MPKYIVTFILILGLAVFIARQDERAFRKAAALGQPAVAAANNVENEELSSPSWYSFFRWPAGTTTWAILLTLLAIAEQTEHTAKAATAAKLNAEYLREGTAAYLALAELKQNVQIEPGVNPNWTFPILNRGTTPAVDCRVRYCTELTTEPVGDAWDFTPAAHHVELGERSTIDPAGGTPLGGRQEIGMDVGHRLTVQESRNLMAGSLVIAMWVNVEFTDVFKRRRYRNFGVYVADGRQCLLPKYNDSGEVQHERKAAT